MWQKNYKTRFFLPPPSREKGRKEERGQRSKKHHFYTNNFGAVKTGRKLFHLFGPPNSNFSNPLRPLFLRDFQEKLVVTISFGKGYARKRAKQKMITVLGVFEFDAFLSYVFGFLRKRGGGGRRSPPPKS